MKKRWICYNNAGVMAVRLKKGTSRISGGGEERRQTIRLLLCGCIVAAALVVGISLLFYQVYERSLTDEMIAYSAQSLDSTDTMISEVFQQIENIAYQQTLTTARLVNSTQRDIVYDYYRLQQLTDGLINMKNSHSYIHSSYIYFNQGSVIVTSFMGTTSLSLFYDTDWLDVYRANANQVVWINGRKPYSAMYENSMQSFEKYMDDTSDVFTLLVPLSSSMRNRGGVVVINVYESEIAKLLSTSAETGEKMEMLMADENGRIIACADSGALYTSLSEELFGQIRQGGAEKGHLTYSGQDGEEMICVYARSRFNNNYILQILPIAQILAPTSSLMSDIMVCAGLFLVIALVLAAALMYLSRRPVRQLYRELEKSLASTAEGGGTVDLQDTLVKMIQDNRTLTKLWENNRMLIKHRTLTLMLQGKLTDADGDERRLESLEIRFPYRYFVCCVLHLGTAQHAPLILDEQYEIIKMQMFPLLQQCIAPPVAGYTVDLDDFNVAIILNLSADSPGFLLNFCQQVQKTLVDSGIIPYTVSIGAGTYTQQLDLLAISFRQACSAMRYALANCPGEIVSFSSICIDQIQTGWGNLQEDEMLEAIRIGDLTSAGEHLAGWLHKLEQAGAPPEAVKQAATRLMGQIMNLLPEIGLSISSSASDVTAGILQAGGTEQVGQLMLDFIADICTQIQSRREHKNAQMMEKIIQYMRSNYQKEISLNQLAEDVYMSVPYLCKIFKEYTNQTFTDYLTALRIEASTELLRSSGKKIMEIAVSVGYTNVQSYIRAFKKVKGMTPTDYRDSVASHKLHQ